MLFSPFQTNPKSATARQRGKVSSVAIGASVSAAVFASLISLPYPGHAADTAAPQAASSVSAATVPVSGPASTTPSVVQLLPATASPRPALRALCIGAGTFANRHLKSIPQAADDARAVAAALLTQRGRGLYSDVDVRVVAGKDVTRARVQQEIGYLRSHARAGDVAVVYLCGYETADDDARARLLTTDIVFDDMETTSPLLSDLHQLVLDLPQGHALILLDLNHGDPLPAPTKPSALVSRGAAHKKMRARLYDPGLTTSDLPKSVRLLFSASGREPSLDAVPGTTPAIGAFASALSEAFSGRANAANAGPAAQPGVLSATDVCRFVQTRVAQLANDTQHPYVPLASDPFEDFPLAAQASRAADKLPAVASQASPGEPKPSTTSKPIR